MWSPTRDTDAELPISDTSARDRMLAARLHMMEALRLLDLYSQSAAAATLDMALHQLDRELSGD